MFEVAAIAGIKLFDADDSAMTKHLDQTRETLALLPKSVQKRSNRCTMTSKKPEKKALHFFCRVALGLLSLALVCGTAVTQLRSDAWWIRVFDFPRIQITALIGLTLAGYAALRDLIRDTDPDIILLSEPTQQWLEQLEGLKTTILTRSTSRRRISTECCFIPDWSW